MNQLYESLVTLQQLDYFYPKFRSQCLCMTIKVVFDKIKKYLKVKSAYLS